MSGLDQEELLARRRWLAAELAKVDQALGGAVSPADSNDLIPVGIAAARAGRRTQTIRRWCEAYGIGVMIAGRYQVSSRRLTQHLNAKKL